MASLIGGPAGYLFMDEVRIDDRITGNIQLGNAIYWSPTTIALGAFPATKHSFENRKIELYVCMNIKLSSIIMRHENVNQVCSRQIQIQYRRDARISEFLFMSSRKNKANINLFCAQISLVNMESEQHARLDNTKLLEIYIVLNLFYLQYQFLLSYQSTIFGSICKIN